MKIKPTARRHHYLPQAYLAGFTDTGSKRDQFFVLNVHDGRRFTSSPINVAVKKDFNRVDIEGESIDAIEQALAPVEERASMAIGRVIGSEKFPNDEDRSLILNLLTLIAVRNPLLRESFNEFRERVFHRIGQLLVSDRNIWEHHVQKAREAGADINDDVPFDTMKEFIEGHKYRLEFSPEGSLRHELHTFNEVLPVIAQRTWSVLVAPNDGPEFICSDHPVTLVWKSGKRGPVGYGLKETEVFFPLGRRVGFYGVFEAPSAPIVKVEPSCVAQMNERVVLNADRHVFSALRSFFTWYHGQVREVQCAADKPGSQMKEVGG